MRVWKRKNGRSRRRQVPAQSFRLALGVRTFLSACSLISLLIPQVLFAKDMERELVEGIAIKPVAQGSLIVRASLPAKVQLVTQRTLFDVYLDEERPLVKENLIDVLEESVELIQAKPTGIMIIEAYCDRRGSGAYSLALGHRRAWQIREFVQNLGVPEMQIHSVNYGNENPQCQGTSNTCWEENVRIQSTFRYIAITEPKLGCLGRLRIQGKDLHLLGEQHFPFLQKIRLAPTKSHRSLEHGLHLTLLDDSQ